MQDKIQLFEYIWIDGYGNTRSKTKVINSDTPIQFSDLPIWNYDGSSTGQAPGSDSEVLIRPVAIYPDPFRNRNSQLVLCDTLLPNMDPHPSNTRVNAVDAFNLNPELEPMFGIEQEFFLYKGNRPAGFPEDSMLFPAPQKDYYCSVGAQNAVGRDCIEECFEKCLQAGLALTGLNAEVAPSQWEFQVCTKGIAAGDQLHMMRYITNRVCEKYGYWMNIHPKPITGDWNGSGCHTNFSTKPMREEGGYQVILDAIEKLSHHHLLHMENYGDDNDLRMTGAHETASYDKFSYGVANRGCSIRIPRSTEADNKGYFEDRRPASNMDPYIVIGLLFSTCCC